MATGFGRFKITVGELTGTPSSMSFYFFAPKESYEGLQESETGVSKVTNTSAADTTDETAPVCTVEALLRSGYGVRKTIVYTTGAGTTLRRKYARMIVAKNKAADFAPSGSFKGGTIKGVVNPTKAVFS
ncbi:hypothetical protein [Microcystis wesenbergii]|uniref:Phage tail protein n=1 Tax=Microcystis wesenbergii NRERC-220 TaxID=3068991 RepID=A0ABU3HK85_9CHRO|nr:hypothetical protein [Microcystis wesenbergii]MDT3674947.1 hypothetical protein [Microcystis wesenbergii NRERC-220]